MESGVDYSGLIPGDVLGATGLTINDVELSIQLAHLLSEAVKLRRNKISTVRNYGHVVLFAHTECGPDIGYNFSFDRLDENWDKHLREKAGWWPGISEALRERRDSNPRPCLLSGKYSLLSLAGADATPEPD